MSSFSLQSQLGAFTSVIDIISLWF